MNNQIYCFGIINLDVITYPVNSWPVSGELVHADNVIFTPGGTALNTAGTIKILSGKPVELLGCVGNDDAGTRVKDFLQSLGLSTTGLVVHPKTNTGICIVTIDSSGERSFIYSSGTNSTISSFNEFLPKIENESFVHLGGGLDLPLLSGLSLFQIVRELKEKGCFVSMDLAWDWMNNGWGSLVSSLKFIDLLSMNEKEAAFLTGLHNVSDSASRIVQAGCPLVIIKLGSRGAFVHSQEYRGIVPGFSVPAVDSTGTGDAFCGALIYSLTNHWPVYESIRFANAVGALCIQQVGALAGIRSYQETLRFIQEQDASTPK